MTDKLVQERHGAVLVARINRPEVRNALDTDVMVGIGAFLTEAENDPSVRALVLTGTGDKAFCAGMDLRAFAAGEITQDPAVMEGFNRLINGQVKLPLICAVNGAAVGGGFELMLGCDLVVASNEARFALPEVKRGLMAGGSGCFLSTRIPQAVALEMVLIGDPMTPERAYQLGLINAVVAPADLMSTALDFAQRIAANGPLGVAASKGVLRLAATDGAAAARRLEEVRPGVFASADATEGAKAFVERRAPVWSGR